MRPSASSAGARLLAAGAAALLIGLTPGPLTARASGTAPLTGDMMSPRFLAGANASESWNYIFRFPQSGYTVFSRFMIFNTGPGSHRASAVGILVAPDGRRALIKNGRSRRKWTYVPGNEGPEMRLAKHVFRLSPDSHDLHMENGRGTFSIRSVSLSRPFFPSPAKLPGGAELERIILAPRMEVTGTATFPGEETVDLGRGRGISYLERSPVADHDSMVSKLMFHSFGGKYEVSLLGFRGTGKNDYRDSSLLLLMEDGEVVFHDDSAAVEYSSFYRDDKSPNYLVPGEFRFRNTSGEARVEGEVKLSLTWRYDWLEGFGNSLVRLFMRRYSHPIQFEHEAAGSLRINVDGTARAVESAGVAVLHIINDPHW